MKRFTILGVAAAAVFAFTGAGNAHVGDIVYPIYELPTSDLPDIFDGSLEDWEDVLPGTELTHDDFTPLNVGEAAGIDPEDSAYRVYLAWHSAGQHVYAGVERIDNVYINTYEGGNVHILAAYDDVEFHLDGDHTGGQYNFWLEKDDYSDEEFKLLQNFQAQQYVIIAESPDGQIIGYQGNGLGWAIDPPYTDAGGTAFGEDPVTTIVEFYVTAWDEINWQGPHLSKRSELVGGKIIGLQVTIADYDANKRGRRCHSAGFPHPFRAGQHLDLRRKVRRRRADPVRYRGLRSRGRAASDRRPGGQLGTHQGHIQVEFRRGHVNAPVPDRDLKGAMVTA